MYANENNVVVNNEVSFDRIGKVLRTNHQIKAIVFVDDIIASGDSAVESLNELNEMCGKLICEKQVTVFVSAICGLGTGIDKLRDAIKLVPFNAEDNVGDFLTDTDRCFSDQFPAFSSPEVRNRARQIAWEYGKKLEKNHPLGYQDSQILVVFHDNCPNNTLPILWKEPKGKPKWSPLFKRT